MSTSQLTAALVLSSLLLLGCADAAPDEDIQYTDAALVNGMTEGTTQVSALITALRSGSLLEQDVLRSNVSVELGGGSGPLLMDAHHGPADASRAGVELYRMLVERGGLSDGATAFNQFLAEDPSNPTGAIAAVGDGTGCSTFGGFYLRGAIDETDPPLARLVVVHDGADVGCSTTGTVNYDLRTGANAVGGQTAWIEMVYPEGLSIALEEGEPLLIGSGGSVSVGLAFDGSFGLAAVEAGADYCIRRGVDGVDSCFEDVVLSVSGGVSTNLIDGTCATCGSRYGDSLVDTLAGDGVTLDATARLDLAASGTLRHGSDTLTLGGTEPLLFGVGFDTIDGYFALVDGEASTLIHGNAATYTFSALPESVELGLVATAPGGELLVTMNGCAARTVDDSTTTVCFVDFDLSAEEGSVDGSIRVNGDGELTHTTDRGVATYTFEAASAEALGNWETLDGTLTLGGTVTRTTDSTSYTARFDAFTMSWDLPTLTFGGGLEALEGTRRIVRADFCAGSTLTYDNDANTTTLDGCVTVDNPRFGTLVFGTEELGMTATYAARVTTLDGPLSYSLPGADQPLASVTFEGWRAENLDTEIFDREYHRSVTGIANITVLGFSGSVESTTGVEVQLVVTDEDATVAIDGDFAIAIDVGRQTVVGGLDFTSYSATLSDDNHTIAHQGVVDMSLMLEDVPLFPGTSMRATFGNDVAPLTTSVDGTITTINGRVLLGVGCDSGTCNENVNFLMQDVAFESPADCERQHPHTGQVTVSGLNPATSALFPALRVRCECDGRAGRETLLPRYAVMRFTEATPTMGRIQVDEANGVCRFQNRSCNEPGAAWVREPTACTTE